MTNLEDTTRADLPVLLARASAVSLRMAQIDHEQAELRRAYLVDGVHTSAIYRAGLEAERTGLRVEVLQLQHRINFLKKLERQARAKQNLAVLEQLLADRGLGELVEEARRCCDMDTAARCASPSRIPTSYTAATWHGTLPQDPATGEVGLSFNVAGGPTVRLRLSAADARHIIETLTDYLRSPAGIQSPTSLEMSSSPRSAPSHGEYVAPAAALSTAAASE
jgi:hypothetical protein